MSNITYDFGIDSIVAVDAPIGTDPDTLQSFIMTILKIKSEITIKMLLRDEDGVLAGYQRQTFKLNKRTFEISLDDALDKIFTHEGYDRKDVVSIQIKDLEEGKES